MIEMNEKKTIKELTKVFKALSNENRLQLFLEILKNENVSINKPECMISEIAGCLKIGAPTISHHVKELENAELIVIEKVGKMISAKINPAMLQIVISVFQKEITFEDKN